MTEERLESAVDAAVHRQIAHPHFCPTDGADICAAPENCKCAWDIRSAALTAAATALGAGSVGELIRRFSANEPPGCPTPGACSCLANHEARKIRKARPSMSVIGKLLLDHGLTTGHGDTDEDMVASAMNDVLDLRRELSALRSTVAEQAEALRIWLTVAACLSEEGSHSKLTSEHAEAIGAVFAKTRAVLSSAPPASPHTENSVPATADRGRQESDAPDEERSDD
jgi:hypothetical protein